MPPTPLRFATFLAPNLYPIYALVARAVGERLGVATELIVGTDYAVLESDGIDAAFVCGLVYVELTRQGNRRYEPLAAPVLQGPRYEGRPIYFSDVIVRRDSPFRTLADLRGRSWCFNEPLSHSGHSVVRYRLTRLGETSGYFGREIAAGWHERSIRLVCEGEIDASAIDSHVLAVALRDDPTLEKRLRIIDTFGPSTIQPLIVARQLSMEVRQAMRGAVLDLHERAEEAAILKRGFVRRFVTVADGDYDDIRAMRDSSVYRFA